MRSLAIPVLALLLFAGPAFAIPTTINYQGQLFLNGTPSTGPVSITFRIFAAQTGGAALWSETDAVTVTQGLFQTTLGDNTAFPAALFTDQVPWLELEVAGQVLAPRTQFQSVPYALSTSSPGAGGAWSTDGTNVWRPTGRVGINTNAPQAALDVHYDGSSDAIGSLISAGPEANSYVRLGHNNSRGALSLGNPSPWGTEPADDARLLHTTGGWQWNKQLNIMGQVGIGKTAPTYPLDVAGLSRSTQFATDRSNLGNGTTQAILSFDNLTFDGSFGYGTGDQYLRFNSAFHPQWGGGIMLAQVTGWRLPEDYDFGRGRLRFSVRSGSVAVDPLLLDPSGAFVNGNFTATGTKCREVSTLEHGKLYFNAVESANALFSLDGESKLVRGACQIELDPKWLAGVTIDEAHPMQVWITFYGEHGEYFIERGLTGFTVREARGSSAEFGWKVEARQKGYESIYLNRAESSASR